MITQVIEFLGKRLWVVVGLLFVTAVLLFGVTTVYPLTFRLSYCQIKDSTYALKETVYQLRTVTQKETGATVKLCIQERVVTRQTNLVETPAAKL